VLISGAKSRFERRTFEPPRSGPSAGMPAFVMLGWTAPDGIIRARL